MEILKDTEWKPAFKEKKGNQHFLFAYYIPGIFI